MWPSPTDAHGLIHETDLEEQELLESYRRHLVMQNKKELESKRSVIEEFKDYAKGCGIELSDDNFEFVQTIGVVAKHPNILISLDPGLCKDKEGLVARNLLFDRYKKSAFNSGYLYGEKYVAMLNNVFRRNLSSYNNWAPRFVDEFWQLDEPGIDAYISLDFDRVRVNVDNYCCLEEDTWYGSPFQCEVSKIPDGSTYLRPPQGLKQDLVAFFFADTYSLEIYWSTKGSLRTFQALEFKNDSVLIKRNGLETHPAKYLHAEYDLENDRFVHFDGAVQYYSDQDYLRRRDSNFQKNVSRGDLIKASSEKAFKFNGNISAETWIKFSSNFFAGDPLVVEYFSGTYPAHVSDALEKLRQHHACAPEERR